MFFSHRENENGFHIETHRSYKAKGRLKYCVHQYINSHVFINLFHSIDVISKSTGRNQNK